jgi:hypothetical protein
MQFLTFFSTTFPSCLKIEAMRAYVRSTVQILPWILLSCLNSSTVEFTRC